MTVKKSVLAALGLLVAAFALVAAGCGGGGGGGAPEALPSSSCTALDYGGDGDPDYILATDLPLQGSSRVQNTQIVAAVKYTARAAELQGRRLQHRLPVVRQRDRAGWWLGLGQVLGECERIRGNDGVIGVIGTFNSGCAAIEIPVLNQAPDGGIPMAVPGEHVRVPHGSRAVVRLDGAGQVLPVGEPQLPASRRERRLPGLGRCRVRAEPGREERVHPERQAGLRPRRRDELPRCRGVARHQDRRVRRLGLEGVELHVAVRQDQADGCRCRLHRRPDRRERGPADQGQGRGPRAEQRCGEAFRAGRLHPAVDDHEAGSASADMYSSVAGQPIDQFQGKAKVFIDGLRSGPLCGRRRSTRTRSTEVRPLRSSSMRSRRRTARARTSSPSCSRPT